MTRRTDWAEYEYAHPDPPRERGRAGGGQRDLAGPDDGDRGDSGAGYGRHGGAEPYGQFSDGEPYADTGAGYGTDDGHGGPADGGPGGRPRRAGRGSRGRGQRRRGEPSGADGDFTTSPRSERAERAEAPADPVERARAICLRLLTGTPRTRKQLADALRKREIPDDAAEEVLSRFEEVGLINDGAFADAWVESRHHGRGLARRALVQELRTKGVESTLIDEAVSQLDSEQEETTARELVARKLRSTRGLDRDKRLRRLAGMLARKGYPQGLALRVVRQALEEEGEEADFLDGEGF
ncbi:recombination regulator RecX [Streptomyces sp. NPDC094437]|uniref:recombination regulator RecX n=1 Tax=Streptomyces sp. NPDC094437 TaxID=3366060 RepID=UPI00382D0B33